MTKSKDKFDIYQKVTDTIVNLLDKHQTGNYQQTWFSDTGEIFANNPTSSASYNGMNQLFLSSIINDEGYTQNRWMTLRQGNKVGAKVMKGQQASPICYYSVKWLGPNGKNITSKVEALHAKGLPTPEEAERIPFLKHLFVFNLDQFENVPEDLFFTGDKPEYSESARNELAEEIWLVQELT